MWKRGDNMVKIDWKPFKEINPELEYTAFSQIGELKSSLSLFSWFRRGKRVQEQLKTTKGFIGYTMEFGFWSKKGVIVGVFDDDNSLMDFAHSGQHAMCMQISKADVKGKMNCYRWKIRGSEIPPKIDEVLAKFQPKKQT
jgi:hypothetical protein